MKIHGTVKILVIYIVCMLAGQAAAVGIGLAIDSYSTTVALAVFIPLYYTMYWVAWRVALFIGDKPAEAANSTAKVATWLFAPAVLALDFGD